MKPVVSIPSELLAALERLAQEAGVSPSQLHERALQEFIARHNPGGLTAQMNRALDESGRKKTNSRSELRSGRSSASNGDLPVLASNQREESKKGAA
ncbi:MAG: ribbon-helix-helix protein, CopG family, partial [Thermoanaerobaculia bacterium]|nr:ribbon-helix-helix protein, CopG family [Thermoanaerobaculia bacterium]